MSASTKDRVLISVMGDEVGAQALCVRLRPRLTPPALCPSPGQPPRTPRKSAPLLQDSVTGLLLAGIGHVDSKNKPNFLVVDASASCPGSLFLLLPLLKLRSLALA